MAYALTYRAPSRARAYSAFAYDQSTFGSTRTIKQDGSRLHVLYFRSDGGGVEVNWYDSSMASLTPDAGVYIMLTIDQQPVVDALTGSYFGSTVSGPATLRWAGRLPAGEHRFEITMTSVGGGVEIPRVRSGQPGVDSLVVSQVPGG